MPAVSSKNDSLGGLMRVLLAALIWGTMPLFVRLVDAPTMVKVFWRCAFAGVTLLAWGLATGQARQLASLPGRRLLAIASQGALLALNWVLFFGGIDHTDVAVAELLAYTGPVFVTALNHLVTGEPFEARVLPPLALALLGTAVILLPTLRETHLGSRALFGAGLAFASAFTYAILMLRAKRIMRGIGSLTLALGEYVVCTALLLPAALLLPPPRVTGAVSELGSLAASRPTLTAFAALALLGLVHTALAAVLFLSGLRRVRTDHAAILTYAEPLSAVVFATLLLGEALTPEVALGGAAIVVAGVLVARMRPAGSIEQPAAGAED